MYIFVKKYRMEVFRFDQKNSVLNNFIAEIRDVDIQKDSMRFRRNIERIGEILSYELSQILEYDPVNVVTPLGEKTINISQNNLVLCSVLRAGLPLHRGILNFFDSIENAFISAYRHHTNKDQFKIHVEYLATPHLDNKILILADPMLATGSSLVAVYESLKELGKIEQIHIVSVIASQEGVDYIGNHFPGNTKLWVATIDQVLNEKGYIVPGLGDAGDLAFGSKL